MAENELPQTETQAQAMTPLERAASALKADLKAFFDKDRANVDWDWDRDGSSRVLVDAVFDIDVLAAGLTRAVLQAIREPSGEMIGDVHDTLLYARKGNELDTAREVWDRMIEVALEEG